MSQSTNERPTEDADVSRLEGMLRHLGRTPSLRFSATYIAMTGVAMAIVTFGGVTERRVLVWFGSSLAMCATFTFVSVTVWYRHQNVINAAITIAVAWSFARIVGLAFAALLLWPQNGSLGALAFVGALLGLPIAIIEWIIAAAIGVAVLRWFRAPIPWPSK